MKKMLRDGRKVKSLPQLMLVVGLISFVLLLLVLMASTLGTANYKGSFFSHAADIGCPTVSGESYASLQPQLPKTDRPAESHPDLNLAIRGYVLTNASRGIISDGHVPDNKPPQLRTLITNNPNPPIIHTYQVYDWDWARMARNRLINDPPVTMLGIGSVGGDALRLPKSAYQIGPGIEALVLFATPNALTVKYTRNDSVVSGYTIHFDGICVDPNLVALYQQLNQAGRNFLPGIKTGQAIGWAKNGEVKIAIRDTGSFMDIRWIDWWNFFPSIAPTPTSKTTPAPTTSPKPTSTLTPTPVAGPINIASKASMVTASSMFNVDYAPTWATNGLKDGREWATKGEMGGAWIKLQWPMVVKINKVVLYDRVNSYDWVKSGTVIFSDGSSISYGPLDNSGQTPTVISFADKTVSSLIIRIDSAVGYNIGFAKVEVYGR